MKIYGLYTTNVERVLFTLAEKGADAELVHVDLSKGEQKLAAHLARHPFGVVPAFEDDDGRLLFESRAIARYLNAKLPGIALVPSEPRALAEMEQWVSVGHSYLGAAGVIRRHLVYARFIGLVPDPAVVEAASVELGRAFDVLDRALAGRDYFAGDFSLADLFLMPEVESIAAIPQVAHLVHQRAHQNAWYERVRARPAWQKLLGDRERFVAKTYARQ